MTEQHYKFQKKQQMIYFHLLSEEDAKEALALSNTVFQKTFCKPERCGFHGALDKQFGCPFLFKSNTQRLNIDIKCKNCTCRKGNK